MNKPYNSKSLRVVFPCGTDKYGEQAESSSELTVALSGQRVILSIEQTRHDICDPITGYGTDTNTSFIELDVDDTEKLISILHHHLSLIKETKKEKEMSNQTSNELFQLILRKAQSAATLIFYLLFPLIPFLYIWLTPQNKPLDFESKLMLFGTKPSLSADLLLFVYTIYTFLIVFFAVYSFILIYYLLQGIGFWVFWEDAGGGYFLLSIGTFLLYIQWFLILVLLLWDFIFNKNQK